MNLLLVACRRTLRANSFGPMPTLSVKAFARVREYMDKQTS
ncbi:hypothetical protein [Sorangium sp. So ce233]